MHGLLLPVFLTALLPGMFTHAQADARFDAQAGALPDESTRRVRVFLVTLSPGSAIWERFGHNALVIEDPSEVGRRQRVAFNWGTFDFDQPNFIGRFIMGRMIYSLSAVNADDMIRNYIADDREVLVQELALTARQARQLRDHCWHHLLPENRDYRYHYYRDNCSTRVRDALDDALDGELSRQLKPLQTGHSYRWHTRRLTADAWHWNIALNFIMGSPIDAPLSAWDEAFVPERLAVHLRNVRLADEFGHTSSLVRSEQVLHSTTRPPTPTAPPNRTLVHLLLGLGIACVLVMFGRVAPSHASARWTLAALLTAWSLLLGAGGIIGVYGWLFTDHDVARYNLNLLAGSPLQLALVLLAPLMLLRRRAIKTTTRMALLLAVMALLSGPIGWVFGSIQQHGEVLALLLPVQLASATALWLASSKTETTKTPEKGAKR